MSTLRRRVSPGPLNVETVAVLESVFLLSTNALGSVYKYLSQNQTNPYKRENLGTSGKHILADVYFIAVDVECCSAINGVSRAKSGGQFGKHFWSSPVHSLTHCFGS